MAQKQAERKPGDPKTRIVVVGAGMAGLLVAQRLTKRPDCSVTLVSDKDYFLFLPRLTEYFAKTIPTEHLLLHLNDVWRGPLLRGRVGIVNPDERTIVLDSGMRVEYDLLVLAVGSQVNYFGTQGNEYSYAFYTKEDADKLREHVDRLLDADEQPGTHTFAIVGGGPTGVEVAYVLNKLAKAKRPDAKVIILEGGPTVLKVLPEKLAAGAIEALRKQGIEIMANSKVKGITPLGVTIEKADGSKETVPCYTTVWAAGSKPNAISLTGVACTQRGEVPVDTRLCLPDNNTIFCVGDCAGSGSPKTAQAAVQEALAAVTNITAVLDGNEPKPFALSDRGTVIALEGDTVGLFFGKLLKGFVARQLRDKYYRYTLGMYKG